MENYDVVVVGAGPYGLSASLHLRSIAGLRVRTFGEPMSFWERNMPAGMLLRSNWTATEIASPGRVLTLEAYQAASGSHFTMPVPLENFINYGHWFQQQAVPDLDRRKIVRIERETNGFRVMPESGDEVGARRVVVAAGIGPFARRPREFQAIPPTLASHTSEHRDLRKFSGKQVLVVGSGQSALESGALLHECGAGVEIIGRSTKIHWLQGRLSTMLHHGAGSFLRNFFYAPTDVGPAGLSQIMARPDLLKHLPRGVQDRLRRRCVRPAGARWLVSRLQHVPISLGRSVVSASQTGDRVCVKLDDGTERTADHVLFGTGYGIDVAKYDFLSRELVAGIERVEAFPQLKEGFETTVPGLHILGAPAAWSFGPLMQFVSGTKFASRALARCIAIWSGRKA
jgi:FAD-dependent urate hydroxylase